MNRGGGIEEEAGVDPGVVGMEGLYDLPLYPCVVPFED